MSIFTKLTKKTLLLGTILAASTGTAWADNADFENELPEGWETVGTMSYYERAKTGSYSIGNSANQSWDTNRGNYIKTTMLEGDVTFWLRSYASSKTGYVTLYTLSEDGTTVGDKLQAFSSSSTTFAEKTYTLTAPTRLAIVINYAHLDNMTYTPYVQADGPGMKVTGATNNAYPFGLALEGATATFNVKSTGTETLNATASVTGGYTIDWTSADIEAGESKDLVVTVTTGGNGTLTIAGNEGIDPVVITLSGTIRDADKLYEQGFTALPEDWTTTGSWYYSEANGAYTTVWYLNSNARLITPLLTISEGETFLVEAKGYSTSNTSYQHLQMQYSADGTTWTNFDSEPTLDPSTWNTFSFTGAPAGQYYIAINASQADIRMFYGGELPKVAKMVVTQPASLNYGIITEATQKTFTIANTGKAQLNGIEVTSNDAAFTISNAPTVLAAGESQEVTITMSAANTGALSSLITVSATDMEDVTFTVSGVVMPEDAFVIDFNDNQLPNGWTNNASNKWSFADGKAYCTSASELVSPKLQFADGDFFIINATSYDDYDNNYIEITGSVDGSDWTAFTAKKFISKSQIPYGSYAPLVVTDIPTTVQYIKIKGYYVRIDEIAGLTYDQNAPALAVSPTTDAAFGKVKAQPEAKTYTVTNAGTGTLTGTIASDNAAFTVSESAFNLGEGESMTFDIALVFDDNYGDKAATITITPDYDTEAAVIINATATTKDPNVWEEDFETASIPATWINNGWTASNSNYGNNGTYMAYAGTSSDNTLITPRLEATEGQELTFEVGGADSTDPLYMQYSSDRTTWSEAVSYTTTGSQTFTAPADGYYYLKFYGRYCSVDNFYGFKEAPLAHDATIAAKSIPTTGNQYVEYTATVTVKEMAGKAEELTAKFFIGDTQYGEDAVETVEANGTKTFTVNFTPDAAVSGDAYFTVSNADLNLESDKVAVTIAAAPEISEDAEWTQTSGTLPVAVVKYTAQNGWNTIALPFALTSDILTSLFGEGYQAYELKGYNDGKLVFGSTSNFYAGYPYLVYTENAPAGQSNLQVNNVSLATAKSDTYTASVAATYATVAEAWGVNADGVIATSEVKPLHAAITMPEGFDGTPRIAFNLTVGANGWASFFNAPALDFEAVEGITAYTATVDIEKSTVTLKDVKNVKKNTGVVVKAEAATYAVPLYTSESTNERGDLKGSATQSTSVTSDYKFYGLSIVDGYAQFTRIEEGGSILAGRAFLQLDNNTPANALSVVFNDDVTSISQVRVKEGNESVFDLNGRQMSGSSLKKGLYIKNGKKVLVK